MAVPSVPGVAESRRDTGRSTDSGSLAAPPAQCVRLLLHTDVDKGLPCLGQSSEQTQAPDAHALVPVTNVKYQV